MTNQRRSQRVALQIPVVVESEMDRGNMVRIDAFTLVVNAHGGLLEVSLPLRPGQKLSLLHAASGRRESCRIVGFRRGYDAGFLVAFEFDCPNANFWPVQFPPADWVSPESGGG